MGQTLAGRAQKAMVCPTEFLESLSRQNFL